MHINKVKYHYRNDEINAYSVGLTLSAFLGSIDTALKVFPYFKAAAQYHDYCALLEQPLIELLPARRYLGISIRNCAELW